MVEHRSTGTAGVSPASSDKFTQGAAESVNSVNSDKWHSTKASETPAVLVSNGSHYGAMVVCDRNSRVSK
jgi:hypothetical protein